MTELISTPANSNWARSLWEEEVRDGRFRACVSCGADPTREGGGANPQREYDNALFLELTGGYGQFTDPQDDSGFLPGWTVVLCHDCAHEACDKLPWLSTLLTPHNSHSHTSEYQEAHPDHYGWDYDMANGTYYPKLASRLFPEGSCLECSHGEGVHERKDGMAVWVCSEEACESKGCTPEA